jgi:Flp pilus assembly protein TadB
MLKALLAIFSAVAALVNHFFGGAARARKAAEATAEAAEARQEAQAAKEALDLETRMQEAERDVLAKQPPMETPHEGTDLFHN